MLSKGVVSPNNLEQMQVEISPLRFAPVEMTKSVDLVEMTKLRLDSFEGQLGDVRFGPYGR